MAQFGIMKKILIIEDNQFVRVTTVDMLEAAGYAVISAETGLVGVQLALDSQPDLIICDILMPQLDGYAVLARSPPASAKEDGCRVELVHPKAQPIRRWSRSRTAGRWPETSQTQPRQRDRAR